MKIHILNKIVLSVILLPLFSLGNIALASEVTGILSTGTNTIGNTLTGTVVAGVPTPPSGGGGGGGSGGSSAIRNGSVDINRDGRVDILDFVYLMANWGQSGSNNVADVNRDGQVDILDFVELMANWTI